MAKNDNNGLLLAAGGLTLAVIFLSQSDKSNPKVTVPLTKGGAVEFIVNNYPMALAAQKKYPHVPWQLFLADAGLESGFGKHAPEFNFYGTKPGKAWTGKKQLLTTHEILPKKTGYNFPEVISVTDSVKYPGKYDWKVKDYFRAYNSPLEAFLDYGAFITHGCYKNATDAPTIAQKIQKIKDCGYATDPGYVAKFLKLVELVELTVHKFVK